MPRYCIFENCNTRSTFGNVWQNPLYCSNHKTEEMFDVVHERCKFENCNTRSTFGNEWKNPLYCSNHKTEEMFDVVSQRCKFENCNTRPNFGNVWKNPLFCYKHKKDGMVNVVSQRCKQTDCDTQVSIKYNGYCAFCFVNLFPDHKLTRKFKTKENYITGQIIEKFNNLDWILDKKVSTGCSRRRPDMLLHLGHRAIIIEIDENQHCSYENICENKRYMEISRDLDHIPITFIRFNPDSYKINEKTIRSCFSVNRKTGICGLSNKKEMQKRLNILYETLIYNLENENEKTINIVNLFYNQKI